MAFEKVHKILIARKDFQSARRDTIAFFNTTTLLHYDHLDISAEHSWSADSAGFWTELERGIVENRQVMEGFAHILQENGSLTLDQLLSLTDGYSCKLLHIIAHFLDGFIGIDSAFYNLVEDSHWLSDELKGAIQTDPKNYWLLHVAASFSDIDRALLLHK